MEKDRRTRTVNTRQAVAQAQALVRKYVPKDRGLSEELIRERHEEATGHA